MMGRAILLSVFQLDLPEEEDTVGWLISVLSSNN